MTNNHRKLVHIGFEHIPSRTESVLGAFAATLNLGLDDLDVRRAAPTAQTDIGFNIRLPGEAVARLSNLLQTNNGQLRLLGISNVIFEPEAGTIEKWSVQNGRFDLELSTPISDQVKPVPRIWLFHLIYLVVMVMLAASVLRFSYLVSVSLLVIAGVCMVGITLARVGRGLAAHILAVSVGLGAPIVVCAKLLPMQTVVLFGLLLLSVFTLRRVLF